MWTKGILKRYADTLPKDQKDALHQEIENIQFEEGREVCVAIEGERAFVRAGIRDLYSDFVNRFPEFITKEDLDGIKILSE